MSEILKIYTEDQLYEMYRKIILAAGVGLTDFNDGSKIKVLLQSNSDIVSSVSMDFKEGIYNAIPIALYEGMGFSKKAAAQATGYLTLYRKPVMTLQYTGTGTSANVTITSTGISATVAGAPSDAFSLTFATYPKTGVLVTALDALTNWTAAKVSDVDCTTLYQYTNLNAKSAINYQNESGMDICLATDIAISVSSGFSVSIDSMTILTNAAVTLPAGSAWILVASTVQPTGTDGNIKAIAIDTANGSGYMNSNISGIDFIRNDSAFSGGTEEETDAERQIRFVDTINALNAGTKNGIIAALEAIDGVKSVGMRTAYPHRGTNTIIVDDGSGSISTNLLASITKVLYGDASDLANYPGKNCEGIGYSIVAPTIVSINIGIVATRLSTVNVSLATIATDIQSAVEQYINTLPLGRDVLLSEIVRVAKNSNTAIYDLSISSPSANIVINTNEFGRTGSGYGGTVSVTVSVASSE